MGFRVSPQAIEDIQTIVATIKVDSPSAARRWLDDLYGLFRNLGDMPGMGPARHDIADGVRIFPVGR